MDEYTVQLEQTIESLKKKLEDASYFKPEWKEEVIPGHGVGKHWVVQLQGNNIPELYRKKIGRYKRGTPKQRKRWADNTVCNDVICYITFTSDNRCVPYIFGKEHVWQKNFEECKKYVNNLLFGVDEI